MFSKINGDINCYDRNKYFMPTFNEIYKSVKK